MKILIDNRTQLGDDVALAMAGKIMDREDGEVKFVGGYVATVKTTKVQKSFVIEGGDAGEDPGA